MTDAASPPNAAGPEGQTLDGRYRLDALLDTGAGRTLWRATDLQNQQTVSVQLWASESSPQDSTMTAARLRQPENVHPVFAGMEWSGRNAEGCAYAVHASLVGHYLDSWLARHALTASEAIELAAELTGALSALHKSGQVHGMLDASVLIVTQAAEGAGDSATLRIVDAGIDSQPAVPHGSAVKAELQRTGKLLERLGKHVVAEAGEAKGSPSGLLPEAKGSPSGLLPEAKGSPSGLLPGPRAALRAFCRRRLPRWRRWR